MVKWQMVEQRLFSVYRIPYTTVCLLLDLNVSIQWQPYAHFFYYNLIIVCTQYILSSINLTFCIRFHSLLLYVCFIVCTHHNGIREIRHDKANDGTNNNQPTTKKKRFMEETTTRRRWKVREILNREIEWGKCLRIESWRKMWIKIIL